MTETKKPSGPIAKTALDPIRAWIARTRELADAPPFTKLPDLADVMLGAADKVEEWADAVTPAADATGDPGDKDHTP